MDFDEMKGYALFAGICIGCLLVGYVLGKV